MAFRTQSEMQSAENRIKQINAAREEAQASMKIAADSIKLKDSIHGVTGLELKKGDEVWLEGKNLKNNYPTAKLAPKRFGPFEIEEEVGTGAYRLKLPKTWKIHPVFHVSLLTPYVKTKEYGEQASGNLSLEKRAKFAQMVQICCNCYNLKRIVQIDKSCSI
jgi:hypothetical protein